MPQFALKWHMAFGARKPRVKTEYNEPLLYDYAIGALGRRMRSVNELRMLLRRKVADRSEYGTVLVETVLARLREQKLLNDAQFAEIFSAYRRDDKKFGKRRVVNELRTKGIKADVIDTALSETYAEVDEEQQAREYLLRKRIKQPTDQKQTARVFRGLMGAGFSAKIIFGILKHWNVKDEIITALDDAGDEIENP